MNSYKYTEHNKGYKFGKTLQKFRPEYKTIISWVPKGSRVLDAGCGDGILGQKLIKEKNCKVYGFDLDKVGVKEAKRKGLRAQVWDANKKFPYKNESFDIVYCNTSLEYLESPNFAIEEMFRVTKRSIIISFPNFGFWVYRIQMLLGNFPALSLFGHKWWDFGAIKFFSLNDFYQLPALKGRKAEKTYFIDWKNRNESLLSKIAPNLFSRSCVLFFIK